MKQSVTLLVTLLLFTPLFSYASVYISEVAWMGTSADANDEWIELYNAGESVDLSGWTLRATDGQPDIALSGILQTHSHALLERTDDTSVTSVTAYSIYTGALGNSGELLELRNANGVVVDSIDGQDDWSIGGDNGTKETLQRAGTPPVGKWVTGAPSPQSSTYTETQNTSPETDEEEQSETQHTTTVGGNILYGSEKEEEEQEEHLEPALTLTLGAQERTVVVGVPTTFLARGYTESGREIVLGDVVWNFGDGAQEKGREVTHTFWYTGDYVVSVVGKRGNFLRDIQDEATVTVHVIDAPVQVIDANGTFITLKNESNEIVDISGCVLVSGDSHFTVPDRTQILGNATVRFPKKVTGVSAKQGVYMFDAHGTVLSEYDTKPPQPEKRSTRKGYTGTTQTPQAQTTQTPLKEKEEKVTEAESDIDTEQKATLLATAGAYEGGTTSEREPTILWWILGLVTAIVTTIVAVILIRHERQEIIEEFYIESDDKTKK